MTMKRMISLAAVAALALANIVFGVLSVPVNVAHAAAARPLSGSETKDWGSLVDGAGASEDVTVYGAALGDFCVASMSVDVVDIVVTCNVTAANVATVRLQNETTGTVDLASGTLRVQVIKVSATGG
jgi:hypothetical protein